jgi:uracil-DNA glycosylase
MGEFLRSELAAGRHYLPAGENVLRAFTFPLERVRVLIVGQDPYPTPGHAVGLSFSVAPDVRPVPRSLDNIFKEYATDLGYPTPGNGDLTPWAERGVMMLNRVLTVQAGTPASHRGKGWEAVTECAIRALVARTQPMVAVLWGRDAATLKPMLTGQHSATIESVHPSPLSASRGFFGSRPFSRANELLAKMGAEPIDWRLP